MIATKLRFRTLGFVSVPAALFLFATGAINAEATAAEIVVSWTEVQDQLMPKQFIRRIPKSVVLSLRGGNVISDGSTLTNERMQSRARDLNGQLGDPMRIGDSRSVSWSVHDRNTLVRTQDRPQHIDVIRITTRSNTTCIATISYALKSGFKEYRI